MTTDNTMARAMQHAHDAQRSIARKLNDMPRRHVRAAERALERGAVHHHCEAVDRAMSMLCTIGMLDADMRLLRCAY